LNFHNWPGYVYAFVHSLWPGRNKCVTCLWTHSDIALCVWYTCVRACVCFCTCESICVCVMRECTSMRIQLPLAIFSDWAWTGSLLPCFLLCIPNYGGEFLGRTTRIARFGLISSLNRDISRLQPSVLPPPCLLEGAALHSPFRSDPSTSERMKFIPIFLFSRASFLAAARND